MRLEFTPVANTTTSFIAQIFVACNELVTRLTGFPCGPNVARKRTGSFCITQTDEIHVTAIYYLAINTVEPATHGKVLYMSQVRAHPSFCSMMKLGVFLLSSGSDASPSQGYPAALSLLVPT